MLIRFARFVVKITRSVLGGLAVGVQAGNVLVCLACIFLGPKSIL